MRILTLSVAALLISVGSLAQTKVVSGVLTAFNQYPVANVEVSAKKSKTSVLTDSLGMFQIVCKEKDVIKIQPEAFKTVSRSIGKKDGAETLSINLVFMDSKKGRSENRRGPPEIPREVAHANHRPRRGR